MKKKYTKKQICEAIAYWKKKLDESYSYYGSLGSFKEDSKMFFNNLVDAYGQLKTAFPSDAYDISSEEWQPLDNAYRNMYKAICDIVEYFGVDALKAKMK